MFMSAKTRAALPLAQTSLPRSISYPLALFLSCTLNLTAAELWIRRSRPAVTDTSTLAAA
jgi:hypothetical protein